MPKFVYCANCGMKLPIFKKAVPSSRIVIEMVEQHERPEKPIELDLKPISVPVLDSPRARGMFSDRFEKLTPKSIIEPQEGQEDTGELRDRRFDSKSTAPSSVVEQVKSRFHSD